MAGTLRIDLAVNTTQRPIRHDSSNAFCAFRFSSLPGRNSRSLDNFFIPYHTILLFSPSSSDTDFIAYASPPTILYGLTLPHCIPSNITIPPWSLSLPLSFIYITLPIPFSFPLSSLSSLIHGMDPLSFHLLWFLLPCDISSLDVSAMLVYGFLLFLYVYSALPLVPVSCLGFYLVSSLLCIIFALHWMRECMQCIGSFLNTIASDFRLRRYNSA